VPQSPGHRQSFANAGVGSRAPWCQLLEPVSRIGRRTFCRLSLCASLREETRNRG
jgi:hypothetical protein